MASKIVYLEVLDDLALQNMLALVGALIKNKYNSHKLDMTIGFAIQTIKGPQKIEFVARRTDFKEIEDGSPNLPAVEGVPPSDTNTSKDATTGDVQVSTGTEQVHNSNVVKESSNGAEQSSISNGDPGDAQPDSPEGN